jgi:hypothetical protein
VLLNKNLKINDPERKKRLLNWSENTAKKTKTNKKNKTGLVLLQD